MTKCIKALAFPINEKISFAFCYKPFKKTNAGYDIMEELKRMGIDENSPFRLYEDHEYVRAETYYPNKLIVPKSLLDNEIKAASKSWITKRFPVLTYYSKTHNVSLWRSANLIKVLSYR